MYYSNTKRRGMEVQEMHMMHLENVLLKDLREGTLDWEETNELTAEYIKKSKADRERLHKSVKSSIQVNRLLFDLLRTQLVYVPFMATRKAQPSKVERTYHGKQLDLYRKVALEHIQVHGRISADTLRHLLLQAGRHVNGQTLTHVFRDDRFQQVSYRRSGWEGAKGRYINVWTAA